MESTHLNSSKTKQINFGGFFAGEKSIHDSIV
jgi:hypothetical protein